MASLDADLRAILERAITEARDEAEKAAGVALDVLAVDQPRPFQTMNEGQRSLRNALRERGRQLGSGDLSAETPLLIEAVAYAQWHRMLFARFLAENGLLIHPDEKVFVTLEDCEELALQEGDSNRWTTAARYASGMLPGIFRRDDPALNLEFTPEGRQALEDALASIPQPIFISDDGLGWVYQFWQSKKKKEVSASENKIEKLDLAAYSQLFTEDYMVRFLLENSLGAWWASQHPDSPIVKTFQYLRYQEDGTPASGAFQEWPDTAAEITVMDPCCGSGHFLVAAFDMLRQMRMEEEGLTPGEAGDAVIHENLFGLEIDPRCVQIAAFALAITAWKAGGYRELPDMNVACSGIPVRGQLDAWKKLAKGDESMERTLERLHGLFVNAPDLGSLISPANVPVEERMFAPDFAAVAPLLEYALEKEQDDDPVAAVFGYPALGVARAAELLARRYTLVATNVPYVAIRRQGPTLRAFLESRHKQARLDLATAFIERCRSLTIDGGTYSLVTPQNWLHLGSYKALRQQLYKEQTMNHVSRLGDRAFNTISGSVVNVALVCLTNRSPEEMSQITGLDASGAMTPNGKADQLRLETLRTTLQSLQSENPDYRFSLDPTSGQSLLSSWADGLAGIMNGDSPRFQRQFWEIVDFGEEWAFQQTTVRQTTEFGGRELVIRYDTENGHLRESKAIRRKQLHDSDRRGRQAWGKWGVAVSSMGTLPVSLYSGNLFDNNLAVVLPKESKHLPAIWAFCSSNEFNTQVRQIDPKMNVTNATLVKVPFDLDRWQSIADEKWPAGLPEPYSDDPTQWTFEGNPVDSIDPLQVAVARLMGYQWPQQKEDGLSALTSAEGIICLVPVAGQEPALERLRSVLAVAYGEGWSIEQQTELLRQVGFEDKGLEAWLRDGFFEQHCKLFHQRPFIWQIWDGRRDGFSALVNYHKLDGTNLDKLIYTYLGDWIRTQQAQLESGAAGASARLVAATILQKKLEPIRDGEPDHDIYVRWKPTHEQPVGWNPDLNDGVRINIRPFVTAGVLRNKVKVNWNKDRGTNPDGSERINNLHVGTAEKLAAREAIKE